MNNIYLRVEDVKDLKLLVGGTTMQRFHEDVQPKKDVEDNVFLQKAIEKRCITMLLSCNMGSPVRLACSLADHSADEWNEIKRNFRKERDTTRAYVRKPQDMMDDTYSIFECSGIVFAGNVSHAGMPVQCYPKPEKEASAIDMLKERHANGKKCVDLKFLKEIKGLSTICRLFVTTYPEELGNEKDWRERNAVALDSV